jgi:hypothetical protein
MLKKKLAFWMFILAGCTVCGPAFGQELVRQKDLAFAQVAAGGGYETVLNLANRGLGAYSGTLYFYTGVNQEWNPSVNGTRIKQGRIDILVIPGATVTYQITDTQLTAGFAVLYAANLNFDSIIEGTLTYYIKSGGTITDSVGITPSRELYRTSIPFDDFSTIALALANLDPIRTVLVSCYLYNAGGASTGFAQLVLGPRSHDARFLQEIFHQAGTQGGRVELSSPYSFIGTACTLTGGELSSLPLLPLPDTYTVVFSVGADSYTGQMVLWAEGKTAQGGLTVTRFNTQTVNETFSVHGELADGALAVFFYGSGVVFASHQAVAYANFADFSFVTTQQEGQYYGFYIGEDNSFQGTLRLTKMTY